MNKKYLEIKKLIQENRSDRRIAEVLSNYHENDIAELLENLSRAERKRIYHVLGIAKTANVFPYLIHRNISKKYLLKMPLRSFR